jgi:hypothetical protein
MEAIWQVESINNAARGKPEIFGCNLETLACLRPQDTIPEDLRRANGQDWNSQPLLLVRIEPLVQTHVPPA